MISGIATSSPFSAAASHSWLLDQPMDLRAAAEGVEARPGTGQGILEPPEAGKIEVFGEAQEKWVK